MKSIYLKFFILLSFLISPQFIFAGEPLKNSEYGCITKFGEKKCGYDCISSYGKIECAQQPNHNCIAYAGSIKCGLACEKKYGKILCANEPTVTDTSKSKTPIIIAPIIPSSNTNPTYIIINKNNEEKNSPKRMCLTDEFKGKRVCGYDCKKDNFGEVFCAESPEHACIKDRFGDIKCGLNCAKDRFGDIICEEEEEK